MGTVSLFICIFSLMSIIVIILIPFGLIRPRHTFKSITLIFSSLFLFSECNNLLVSAHFQLYPLFHLISPSDQWSWQYCVQVRTSSSPFENRLILHICRQTPNENHSLQIYLQSCAICFVFRQPTPQCHHPVFGMCLCGLADLPLPLITNQFICPWLHSEMCVSQ